MTKDELLKENDRMIELIEEILVTVKLPKDLKSRIQRIKDSGWSTYVMWKEAGWNPSGEVQS